MDNGTERSRHPSSASLTEYELWVATKKYTGKGKSTKLCLDLKKNIFTWVYLDFKGTRGKELSTISASSGPLCQVLLEQGSQFMMEGLESSAACQDDSTKRMLCKRRYPECGHTNE